MSAMSAMTVMTAMTVTQKCVCNVLFGSFKIKRAVTGRTGKNAISTTRVI